MVSSMGRLHRLLALAAVLGGLLLIRGRATAQPTCQPATATDEVRLTVSNRPDHALIADASVELAAPAPLYLEYGNDQVGWLRTPTATAAETQQLPIVRLRPETSYVV